MLALKITWYWASLVILHQTEIIAGLHLTFPGLLVPLMVAGSGHSYEEYHTGGRDW